MRNLMKKQSQKSSLGQPLHCKFALSADDKYFCLWRKIILVTASEFIRLAIALFVLAIGSFKEFRFSISWSEENIAGKQLNFININVCTIDKQQQIWKINIDSKAEDSPVTSRFLVVMNEAWRFCDLAKESRATAAEQSKSLSANFTKKFQLDKTRRKHIANNYRNSSQALLEGSFN